MKMRDVVAAVKIVIDKDLPVAMDVVGAAVEVVKLADGERRDALYESSERCGERRRVIIEINEDEAFPGFRANGNKAILRAVEILESLELRHGHAPPRWAHRHPWWQ